MLNSINNSLKKNGIIGTIKKIPAEIRDKSRLYSNKIIFKLKIKKAQNGFLQKSINGHLMNLDITDVGISKELILTGIHEKNSTNHYKKIITPGMHIGDFGANIGYYSLISAALLKGKGHIYAFEPSPYNFTQLKRNIELNNFLLLFSFHNAGLGAVNSKLKFYLSSKGNMSSFIKREEYEDIRIKEIIDVDVIKADDFFADKKLDLVRMDVEGFEIEIINGMHELLSRAQKPKYLFIEIHSELLHQRGSSAKEFVNKLCSYGYEIDIAFYRGKKSVAVQSKSALLNHPLLEKGYWETFFISQK